MGDPREKGIGCWYSCLAVLQWGVDHDRYVGSKGSPGYPRYLRFSIDPSVVSIVLVSGAVRSVVIAGCSVVTQCYLVAGSVS